MRSISNDDDLRSYRGFMDYDWARAIDDKVARTVLEYPVFDLIMSWKGASNTFTMPLLMVEGSASFWTAYSKSHVDQSMVFTIIRGLSERLFAEVEFTNVKKKEVSRALDRIVRDAEASEKAARDTFVFPTNELWHSYLTPEQPGTAEFHLNPLDQPASLLHLAVPCLRVLRSRGLACSRQQAGFMASIFFQFGTGNEAASRGTNC